MEEQNHYMQYLAHAGSSTPTSGGHRGSGSGRGGSGSGRGGSGSSRGGSATHSRVIPPTPGFQSTSHDSTGHRTPLVPPMPEPHLEGDRELYFRMIRDILNDPGHHLLPTLHPERPPNTQWFSYDTQVATAIKEIFEKDFKEPFTGVKNIPVYVYDRWFIAFARKYHWEEGITGIVREEFDKKLKQRLGDMVGRWKKSWFKKGDEGLHHWFSPTVRQSLIAYWTNEGHQSRSNNSKDARSTSGSRSTHRSGRTSFLARGRQLAEEKGESETDLLDVLAFAKRKPDGSFMDADSENLYYEVNSRLQEMTHNSDPESIASVSSKNKVFLQAAPRRRGKISGIGSIQSQIDTTGTFRGSSSQSQSAEEVTALKDKLATAEQKIIRFDRMWNYLTQNDPKFAAAMLENPETPDPTPEEHDVEL